jgi:hypothetical protein
MSSKAAHRSSPPVGRRNLSDICRLSQTPGLYRIADLSSARRGFSPNVPLSDEYELLDCRSAGRVAFDPARQNAKAFACVCPDALSWPLMRISQHVRDRSSCVLVLRRYRQTWLSPSVRSWLASSATSNGLIRPEGRPKASIAFPQRLRLLFSPAAKRHSSREVKKAGLRRPPLRCGPKGCGPIAPRAKDRHRGRDGRGPSNKRRD